MPVVASFVLELGIHIGNWLQHQSSRANLSDGRFKQTNHSSALTNHHGVRIAYPILLPRHEILRSVTSLQPSALSVYQQLVVLSQIQSVLNSSIESVSGYDHSIISTSTSFSRSALRQSCVTRHRPKRRGSQHIPEKQEFALLMNRQVHCVPIFHNPEIREMHARICTRA